MTANGWSQESNSTDSKKIGLVLSGGGAKGFAHIGVLKVIDSLDIKIDYIAGTSMGAIIGSLYASGYSGKQLDSIFQSLNITSIVNDDLPRASQTFYEREHIEKYAVTLPFSRFRLSLPSALSRGQNVYSLLTKLLLHVNDVDYFENLPIPFFCMATDVETGEEVMLDHGNLAMATRASGAFPTLFQPVEINGRFLIDGGVVNNYPIDELRAKGMDLIIGVDVQDGLADMEEMGSAPDVLVQINNFRTIEAMKNKSLKTDIYIKPDIKEFSVVSFSQGEKIIKSGEVAAKNAITELNKLPKYSFNYPKTQIVIRPIDSLRLDNIRIFGNYNYSRSYILGKLKLKTGGSFKYEDFADGMNNLVATNNFDNVYYKLNKVDLENTYDLHISVKEAKTTAFLKLGIHYDDLYKSAALINYTKNRVLFNNDVFSLDVILGDNVRFNMDYLIDKGFYWSIGLNSRFNQFNKSIGPELFPEYDGIDLSNVRKLNVDLNDFTNQLYLQTLLGNDFAFTIGGEHKRLIIKTETLKSRSGSEEDDFYLEDTDYISAFGNLKFDTFDDKYFPTKGFYFLGDFHLTLFASHFNPDFSQFSTLKSDIGYAFSVSDRLSFNLRTQGGFRIGDDTTPTLYFALGGYGNNYINNFIPFYGYEPISLIGDSFVKSLFNMDYEIFDKHHILLSANYANIENSIFETGEWFSWPDYSGYAVGYSLETFLGPVEAKYSWSPENSSGFWLFNVGFWF